MSRNTTKSNIKKLLSINVNGYKVDVANYIYNPSHEHNYPHLSKVVEETDTKKTVCSFYYFKHYDGTGEYIKELYSYDKKTDGGWGITKLLSSTVLSTSNRFSMKALQAFVE